MEIKDLNKSQLILLTLLVSFVVSIATGITAVSLMQQLPSATKVINRVIERTINNVTTAPTKEESTNTTMGDGDTIVDVYLPEVSVVPNANEITNVVPAPLGQGVIISEVGLVLVDSSILLAKDEYQVMLNKKLYPAQVLKKFGNGFTIIRIMSGDKPKNTTGTDTGGAGSPETKTN